MKRHISLILVLMLLTAVLVGCSGNKYEDGEYTGEATGMEPMTVSVTVTEGKISAVEVVEQNETEGYSEEALVEIPKIIVEKNSTDVDALSGATLTSNGIKKAVNDALGIEK